MFLQVSGGDGHSRAEDRNMMNRKQHQSAHRTNARQNHMNGLTLFSFTVGPWRIMALMPWMNVLWAAAMLLIPVSY